MITLVFIDDEDLGPRKDVHLHLEMHTQLRKNAVKEDHIEGTVQFAAVSVCTILIFFTFKNTPELHPNFWYQK